ncbi:hypothetical protein HF313_15210 [Massilia atriviolacea]|uniref:Uncharacterized protein n=1 Tax=Massilia atriviolacea TaxID=2495579 RepID=A0A430HRB0_9BURK|nr:hypothetical protein [Massilia atriviolacea]RSZ60061.1 hypothetical protein EJB06_07730 [Massilia atriviolacea]
MTALTRLWDAEDAMRDGRHDDALQGFIWFYQHALDEDPSLEELRYYLIGMWVELGRIDPKALDALRTIRADKAKALLAGDKDRETFWDIVIIDAELDEAAATYQFYKALAEASPVFAAECALIAMPAIVEAQDYALAAKLMPPAEPFVREMARVLEQDIAAIKQRPFSPAPERRAEIATYVTEVQRVLTVLAGNGEREEAASIKALAVSLIKNPSVRRDVAAGLSKRSKAQRT